jgi:hypothetical protein
VAVGEDLAVNLKIEERRRFLELSVPAVSRFTDSPEVEFFLCFLCCTVSVLADCPAPKPGLSAYYSSGFSVENRTASVKFVFRFFDLRTTRGTVAYCPLYCRVL